MRPDDEFVAVYPRTHILPRPLRRWRRSAGDLAGGRSERAKVPSRVRAIEYQGNFVKVILDKIGDDELIAYVPDRVFYRDPFSVGDVVIAGWEKDKTRMLA